MCPCSRLFLGPFRFTAHGFRLYNSQQARKKLGLRRGRKERRLPQLLADADLFSDAQIQLISGHESKKSLEVYQHLSLESVDKAYQDAVQSVGI
jgi:hypothetical protein